MQVGMTPYDGWIKRDGVELIYPRGTTASLTSLSAGSPFVWTSYAQVVAATSEAFTPVAVHAGVKLAAPSGAANAHSLIEWELATGAAGAEVPYARFTKSAITNQTNPGPTTETINTVGETLLLGPTVIPGGTRIAHRVRTSTTSSTLGVAFSVYLTGYSKPPVRYRAYSQRAHSAGVHRSESEITPSEGSILVNTTWTEIIASAPTDLLLRSISRQTPGLLFNIHNIMELGTGSSGQEQARVVIGQPGGNFNASGRQEVPIPLLIKRGERFAARVTFSVATSCSFGFEEV